jgi:hypothetical protein
VHLSTLDPLAQFDDVDLTNARQFARTLRRSERQPLFKKPKPEKPISDGGSPAVGRMHGPVTVHQTFNVTGVHDDTHLRARLGREAEKRVRRALTVELERRGG